MCRLYTTTEIIEWFTHIAAASEELRIEFDHMVNSGGTPKYYGLKVRSHPVLLVTSAVKMRSGTEMKVAYGGDISETIIFDRDETWIARNFEATEAWLKTLGVPAQTFEKSGALWTTTHTEILAFLGAYSSHPLALRAQTALLAKYVRRMEGGFDELTEWSVLLCSSADATSRLAIAGHDVGLIQRAEYPEADQQRHDRYTIRRLVSPRDEQRDLTPQQIETALTATIAEWERTPEDRRRRKERPTTPSGRSLREVRSEKRGLLMLYPLDPAYARMPDRRPIVGLAISFPSSDNAEEITYTINNVFTANGDDPNAL